MNRKEKITKKKEEEYYAFFDAEYTCYMKEDRLFNRAHNNEVLSVGLVITDKKFRIKKTFYSVVRPKYNPILTPYCRSLTGLKQREVDRAPDYETAFQKMSKLFQKYPVREIFVWGSDHNTLEDDLTKNHNSVATNHKKIVHIVRDITKKLTCRVYGRGITVSLADMKYICGRPHKVAHNALEDARDLYFVTKTVIEDQYDHERAKKLYRFIEDREIYHRYRRFKPSPKKNEILPRRHSLEERRKFQDYTGKFIAELKQYCIDGSVIPVEIQALCDDLRIIADLEAQDCPKLD